MDQLFLSSNYTFNIHAVPFYISGILITAEALFVYFQNRKSPLNFGFAAVTVCAGLWLTGIGFIYSSFNEPTALIWSRYYCWLGIIFISPSVYLFSAAVERESLSRSMKFIYANYIVALAFYIFCISTPYFIQGLWSYSWGYYPRAGVGQSVFMVWYIVLMILAFINFIRCYMRETVAIKKQQVKFIIIAFIFGGIGGSIDFLGNYGVLFYPFGSLAVFIFLTVIAYSIVNYKLMDIETVLHKTILWILSFSIITVPIFSLYQFAFPMMKNSVFWQLAFGIVSFIVFALYLRLVQPKIDHIFQRRRASLDEISSRFMEDLVHLKGIDNLIGRMEETIGNTLYPQWIDIFIYNDKREMYVSVSKNRSEDRVSEFGKKDEFLTWLNENNRIVYSKFIEIDPVFADIKESARDFFNSISAAVVVPLILNEQLLGIINLGKKSNLRRYNALDFNFLTTLKNQSAIAISNSLIYQNIEEQVTQRTAELVEVQKQLIQVEKLATVGTLSGGVAHEINNPLTAILTNVQMLLSFDEGDSDTKESLELIEEATQRCRTIVQKLMAYAKKPLESADIAKVDLSEVLKKVIAFLGYQLEQDDVKIIVNVSDGKYPVMGNHNELEQVLTNIILNARDAIVQAKKKGSIHISLSKKENKINLQIKDEGDGIPKDVISKIFDPFYTTKDVGKGLGLGLSICQSIIDKHKGRIMVESKVGNGALFTVELPQYSKLKQPANVSG